MINSLAKLLKQQSNNNASNYVVQICINFQVVFFESNFRDFGTRKAVCKKIIKLHIFIESRREYCEKGTHL